MDWFFRVKSIPINLLSKTQFMLIFLKNAIKSLSSITKNQWKFIRNSKIKVLKMVCWPQKCKILCLQLENIQKELLTDKIMICKWILVNVNVLAGILFRNIDMRINIKDTYFNLTSTKEKLSFRCKNILIPCFQLISMNIVLTK